MENKTTQKNQIMHLNMAELVFFKELVQLTTSGQNTDIITDDKKRPVCIKTITSFAEDYRTTRKTIRRWIEDLEQAGLIKKAIVKNGRFKNKQGIYVNHDVLNAYWKKTELLRQQEEPGYKYHKKYYVSIEFEKDMWLLDIDLELIKKIKEKIEQMSEKGEEEINEKDGTKTSDVS